MIKFKGVVDNFMMLFFNVDTSSCFILTFIFEVLIKNLAFIKAYYSIIFASILIATFLIEMIGFQLNMYRVFPRNKYLRLFLLIGLLLCIALYVLLVTSFREFNYLCRFKKKC